MGGGGACISMSVLIAVAHMRDCFNLLFDSSLVDGTDGDEDEGSALPGRSESFDS